MKGMQMHYATRVILALILGALFVLMGAALWVGALVAALALAWFILAPRIGRYAAAPRGGAIALQNDERGRAIRDAAARNAFVVCMLGLAGVILYFHARTLESVPIDLLLWILMIGVLAYFGSDMWLRRAQA